MKFTDKFIKSHLELIRPLAEKSNIDTSRTAQDTLGKIMHFVSREDVVVTEEDFGGIPAAIAVPRDEIRTGIILYIHGGGFVSGGLEYAKGFASMLCAETGMRCACVEYRLAPEHPFPAALDDVLIAYKHLFTLGYDAKNIILAGESAGGGLTFSLCLRLRDLGIDMPCGIIAISPWCDLSLSGDSMERNKKRDLSLSRARLEYFAGCYLGEITDTDSGVKDFPVSERSVAYLENVKNPYVSPIFAHLEGMPPALIFAGGDEILLSDAERIHELLLRNSIYSKLFVRPGMWHAYHLYNLKSSKTDFDEINAFIKKVMPSGSQRKLRWMLLDNSGKIYPASRTSRWANFFRLSATMRDDVDREVLQSALDVTVRRFPSIAVRLRTGTFWYYLQEVEHAPKIKDERAFPLYHIPFDDIRSCAFRVLVYNKRIAIEFFHAITDGNGGLVFLKTLLAEYISQKYGEKIPCEYGVLDRLEPPDERELVDCFPKHSGKVAAPRMEKDSYRIWGEPEHDGYMNVTTFMLKSDELVRISRSMGVTVTALLAAAMIKAGIKLQNEDIVHDRWKKPVKVLVPCDLRRIFGERTLRNFALYATPGVDPRLGDYSVEELCEIVSAQMKLEITEKNMRAKIRTNVKDEENMLLKLTPLFLKNVVMKIVFSLVGERKSMMTMSNLGAVKLPECMRQYIDRFDFVLNVQSTAPYNSSVITYGKTAYLTIVRDIKEPRLERELYRILRDIGVSVKVESNQR